MDSLIIEAFNVEHRLALSLPVVIFVLTYFGMALGHVPGLKLERTGIALLAAVALLSLGDISIEQARAAIDLPTILLLFALMIVSAQFQQAGLYEGVATKIALAKGSTNRLLFLTILSAGLMSALLANDIVVFAMAPVLAEGIRRRGLDPRPFLLGMVGAANAGSAMTVIGNPQNILIGQVGDLDFWKFMIACGVPGLVSLGVVFAAIRLTWHRALTTQPLPDDDTPRPPPVTSGWQCIKGIVAILALLALFATNIPREIGALTVAALLLLSRRLSSRDMIGAVDWHLLILFTCLFIVTEAFAATGLAGNAIEALAQAHLMPDQLSVMAPLLLAASNTIGNVPATMLILSVWPLADSGPLYGLALLSTLAGNLLIVGSMANIITAERAASCGVRLGFMDFARAGVPMTIATMAIAAGWLALGGWMGW